MIKNYKLITKSMSDALILSQSGMVFSMQQIPEVEEKPYSLRSSKKDQVELRDLEDTTHILNPQKEKKRIKKESVPNIQDLEETNYRPAADILPSVEQSEFSWPALVKNNESWKQAAIRAAESWGMTQEEYLKEANDFLKNHRVLYRKTRILTDLIPLPRPLNYNDRSIKFAFRE